MTKRRDIKRNGVGKNGKPTRDDLSGKDAIEQILKLEDAFKVAVSGDLRSLSGQTYRLDKNFENRVRNILELASYECKVNKRAFESISEDLKDSLQWFFDDQNDRMKKLFKRFKAWGSMNPKSLEDEDLRELDFAYDQFQAACFQSQPVDVIADRYTEMRSVYLKALKNRRSSRTTKTKPRVADRRAKRQERTVNSSRKHQPSVTRIPNAKRPTPQKISKVVATPATDATVTTAAAEPKMIADATDNRKPQQSASGTKSEKAPTAPVRKNFHPRASFGGGQGSGIFATALKAAIKP